MAAHRPMTLLDLLEPVRAERTAVILPEQNRRVTYGALRSQVQALAETFAAVGIRRGDRIAIALPNGLPMVVSFLAASAAGSAAPLNPVCKGAEFGFYLGVTNARVVVVHGEGA